MQKSRKTWGADEVEGNWTIYHNALWWDGKQKGDRWKGLKAFRAGTSTILGLAYGNKFGNKLVPVKQYIEQMLAEREVEINEEMQLGIDEEDLIRDRHLEELRKISPEADVEEVGLVIPLRYPWMNSSPDGIIYDPSEKEPFGVAEYKRTRKMYRPLLPMGHPLWYKRTWDTTLAKNPTQLWSSHYAQIQHHLFVTGLSWCDYCVMADSKTEHNWFRIRIRKNPTYWLVLIKQVEKNLTDYQERMFREMIMPPRVKRPTAWDMSIEDLDDGNDDCEKGDDGNDDTDSKEK